MWVGPNRVITGVLKAAAKCRGPESVVIKRADRRTQALVKPIPSGRSARLTTLGCSAIATISRAVGFPRRFICIEAHAIRTVSDGMQRDLKSRAVALNRHLLQSFGIHAQDSRR